MRKTLTATAIRSCDHRASSFGSVGHDTAS